MTPRRIERKKRDQRADQRARCRRHNEGSDDSQRFEQDRVGDGAERAAYGHRCDAESDQRCMTPSVEPTQDGTPAWTGHRTARACGDEEKRSEYPQRRGNAQRARDAESASSTRRSPNLSAAIPHGASVTTTAMLADPRNTANSDTSRWRAP